MIDTCYQNKPLADAVNNLLAVGFYLVNIGYVTLVLKYGEKPQHLAGATESLSTKVGLVLLVLVLGAVHFFRLYVFLKVRRRALLRSQKPPVPSEQFVEPVHAWSATQ